METQTKFCYDCDSELNAENTGSYNGFDSSNYYYATIYGGDGDSAPFTKCDDCFEADIDRYLETAFE